MADQRLKPESLLASPTYQYGTVPSLLHIKDGLVDFESSYHNTSNKNYCSRRGIPRFGAIFGLATIVTALLWISIYTLEHQPNSANSRTTLDGVYDNYGYQVSPPSFLLSSTVPLLGSSKTQQQANRNREYLYFEPESSNKKKHKQSSSKHKHRTEMVGSSIDGAKVEAPNGCEATVMLMRHCEKADIREHCDYMGYERSVYLASLFGNDDDARWPAPSYLIAEMPGKRRNPDKRNFREMETILPLADKFNLTIDTSFSTLDTKALATKVQGMLRSGEMCGKLIVISWMHSKIPRVAHALGCGPEDGCPLHYRGADFDVLWQIKFVYRKLLHSTKKSLKPPKHKQWMIYGSVQREGFDPLAFSKKMGDYPAGGTTWGGRWRDYDHEVPERDLKHWEDDDDETDSENDDDSS